MCTPGILPGETAGLEDTRCPGCAGLLIERRGYRVARNRILPAASAPIAPRRSPEGGEPSRPSTFPHSAAPGIPTSRPRSGACWMRPSSARASVPARSCSPTASVTSRHMRDRSIRGPLPPAVYRSLEQRKPERICAGLSAPWRPPGAGDSGRRDHLDAAGRSPHRPGVCRGVRAGPGKSGLRPLFRDPVAFSAKGRPPRASDSGLRGPRQRGRPARGGRTAGGGMAARRGLPGVVRLHALWPRFRVCAISGR